MGVSDSKTQFVEPQTKLQEETKEVIISRNAGFHVAVFVTLNDLFVQQQEHDAFLDRLQKMAEDLRELCRHVIFERMFVLLFFFAVYVCISSCLYFVLFILFSFFPVSMCWAIFDCPIFLIVLWFHMPSSSYCTTVCNACHISVVARTQNKSY